MQAGGEGAPPAGEVGRTHQESCDGNKLKDNGKVTSVIRAATEIKC